MHSSVSERRAKPRYRLQFPLMITGCHPGEGQGITRDVSEFGAYFYTDSPLAVGQVLEFKMLMSVNGTTTRAVCNATVIRLDAAAAAGTNGVAVHMNRVQLV